MDESRSFEDMDESWSFEDKDESIWIPYAINMQPIRKLERIKWKNEWIASIDSYLTLSYQHLYKEYKAAQPRWWWDYE